MTDRPRTATATPPAACSASQPPAPPASLSEAVARLQAHLVLYARVARSWGPELRDCLDGLAPFLPPETVSDALLEAGVAPFELALVGEVECLLADALSPLVAGFEAAARSLPGEHLGEPPGEPLSEPVSAARVWRELDPGAPPLAEPGE